MKIVICEDQTNELRDIEEIVNDYVCDHEELDIEVKGFEKPLDMLEEIERNGAPDIALLDICMPGILGTEAAREILKKSEDSADIIFLTGSPDFAVEAFSLHASDYVPKPYTKERLTESLDRVVEARKKRLFVPVACGKEIHRIDLYQVLYAEVKNHNVEIHLRSGNCLKVRTTLTEFRELFQNVSGFVIMGASYIVNLRYVQSLFQTTLEMTNGEMIPVPRRLREDLRKQYFAFYTKEATGK